MHRAQWIRLHLFIFTDWKTAIELVNFFPLIWRTILIANYAIQYEIWVWFFLTAISSNKKMDFLQVFFSLNFDFKLSFGEKKIVLNRRHEYVRTQNINIDLLGNGAFKRFRLEKFSLYSLLYDYLNASMKFYRALHIYIRDHWMRIEQETHFGKFTSIRKHQYQ